MSTSDESFTVTGSTIGGTTVGGDEPTTDAAPTTSESELDLCDVAEILPEMDAPASIAEAICKRRNTCGCDAMSMSQCASDVAAYFDEVREFANGQGMVYDGNCLARRLAEFASTGCSRSGYVDFLTRRTCGICYMYSAPVDSGNLCETNIMYQGLVSPCGTSGDICMSSNGSICSPPRGEGDGCYFSGDCADGFVCETGKNSCTASQPGKPCVNPALFLESSCALDLWCDGGLCQEKKSLGAPCESDEECLTMLCNENACIDYIFACDFSVENF